MENLDTPEKLRAWMSTRLGDLSSRYLSLDYEVKHIGNTWVISAPPLPDKERRRGDTMRLIVADDRSMMKVVTNYFFVGRREGSESERSVDELIADGSWRTDKYLSQVYPKVDRRAMGQA